MENNKQDPYRTLETTEEGLALLPDEVKGIATNIVSLGDKLRLEFNTRDALFFQLSLYTLLELPPEMILAVKERLGLLKATIDKLEVVKNSSRGFQVRYSIKEELKDQEDDLTPKIAEAISSAPVQTAIAELLGIKPDSIENTDKVLNKAIDTGTHRQPNGLLKTLAKHTGRDIKKPTLFNSGDDLTTSLTAREAISRKSGDLMLHLVKNYQEADEDWIRIDNLSKLARETGLSSAQEVKNCLELLGGYVHPFFERKVGGGVVIQYRQLIEVDVHYSERVLNRCEDVETEVKGYLKFLKNEPVDYIEYRLCKQLRDQLTGNKRDLGSRVIYNRLLQELPNLSSLAYQVIMYALSNKEKTQAIGEEKLLPKIGYDQEVVYKDGIKRVRERILKALLELQEKGHLESYSYDPDKRMYSLTKSEKTAPKKSRKTAPDRV